MQVRQRKYRGFLLLVKLMPVRKQKYRGLLLLENLHDVCLITPDQNAMQKHARAWRRSSARQPRQQPPVAECLKHPSSHGENTRQG